MEGNAAPWREALSYADAELPGSSWPGLATGKSLPRPSLPRLRVSPAASEMEHGNCPIGKHTPASSPTSLSKGFRRWLTRRFLEETEGAPNTEALQSALNAIEAKAHFDAPQMEVNLRVAGFDGRL